MRTPVLALLASAVLLLALGAGTAMAGDLPAVQSADQSASTNQSATAGANAQQIDPSNSVVDVRIGSPGSNGAVSQSNSNGANASAGNSAQTGQQAAQGAGGGGVQSAVQKALTGQGSSAAANAVQVDPSNDVVRVRIHSPGTDGPVTQSNDNASTAKSGNSAATEQAARQGQGAGGGVQDAQQSAGTKQESAANADAKQLHPSNDVVRIRIHSAGDNGDVSQSNTNAADASSGNKAATGQSADQTQGGSGGGGTQYAGQEAWTGQAAGATADAVQKDPSNSVTSIRLHSPGSDGAITQSNSNSADASAGNAAKTIQGVSQDGGGSGGGVQASDQTATTLQEAVADANAYQDHPSNQAGDVRIGSPGDGGDVTQSNDNASSAQAGNGAMTLQDAKQALGGMAADGRSSKGDSPKGDCCSNDGKAHPAVQAAGQSAYTGQSAAATSDAKQFGASNEAGGVYKDSPGGGGSVTQSNTNASDASAGNKAGTGQWVQQVLGGSYGGTAVQAAGQDASTGQEAAAKADALQKNPCNQIDPVWLDSKGDGGSVDQSNANEATGRSGNLAETLQKLLQLL